MRVTGEYVKRVIGENPAHSIMIAEDVGPSSAKLGFYTGDADTLGKALDMLEQSISTPFRVILRSRDMESRKGERKAKDKDFVFILPGSAAAAMPAAAAAGIPYPVNGASAALAERAGHAVATNEFLREQLAAMREEMRELRDAMNAPDDEGDEPMNAAPAPSVWESEAVVKELVGIGRAIAGSLLGRNAPPAAHVQAAPAAVPGIGELSEEDLRAVVALRNMKQHDPETYNTYAPLILDTYAAKEVAQPASNGQG